MRSEAISSELLQRVTVVIRSVGERTEKVCRALVLEQGVPPEAVFVVRERPFSKTLRVGSEIGLEQGKKWTLFVDADLLLRRGSIQRMLNQAESEPNRVCEVQGYCLDKFFGGVRIGGIRVYRTSLLNDFIDSIPEEGVDIRPEARALQTMASKGFPGVTVPQLIGLHGFEQSYKDIFRTCLVHAHKHLHLANFFVPFWRTHAEDDEDYRIALAGFAAGIEATGSVRIDKELPYLTDAKVGRNYVEKSELRCTGWDLEKVEEIVSNWQQPDAYPDFFPFGMLGSDAGWLRRVRALWLGEVRSKGFINGSLKTLGRSLLYLSRDTS